MFAGHTFCVSPTTSPLTVAALTQRGGRVVYDLDSSTAVLTCVVVAHAGTTSPLRNASNNNNDSVASSTHTAQLSSALPSSEATPTPAAVPAATCGRRGWAQANHFAPNMEDRVRIARLPVVYELWVHQSIQAGRPLLPCKGGPEVVAYDPFLFAGLRFTTTQLPLQLKANLIAMLQFYGAEYHRDLMNTTNTVVYSHMPLLRGVPNHAGTKLKFIGPSANTERSHGEVAHEASGATLPIDVKTPPRSGRKHSDRGNDLSSASDSDASQPGAALYKSPSSAAAAAPIPLTKLAVAQARKLLCVTPQWVQLCLNAGALLPQSCYLGPAQPCNNASQDNISKSGVEKESCADTANNEDVLAEGEVERWMAEALSDICQVAESPVETTAVVLTSSPIAAPLTKPVMTAQEQEFGEKPSSNSLGRKRSGSEAVEADSKVRAALKLADRLAADGTSRARQRRRYR